MVNKAAKSFTGITLSGVQSIFRKELIQLIRDPYLVIFIITLPIIQLVITGLAISKDLKHVDTVVCNYDKRNASIELLKAFHNSTFFDISDGNYVDTEDDVIRLVNSGKYRVGVVIPPNYSNQVLTESEQAEVTLVLDGTNGSVAKGILNAANLVVANHARVVMNAITLQDIGQSSPLGMVTLTLNNPEMKTSYFLIPGILAIIMHMMTIMFTSFAIVREREAGTLEQLMVTPIRITDLMVGKVLPYVAIGFMDMILTLAVMVWFFNISISGNFWFLCVASIIFIVTSLGIGLVISTVCRSQVQAVQLSMFLLIPSFLLSGFTFPLEPMPWIIKIVSYALPLTYYMEIIRGVVIKGTGFNELWLNTLVLTGMAVLLVVASITRFKKQVA
ncbi:MAG: ABC transporter permease [Vampirovibrio sp.]|nr:ABC transporter permease [Vampirovibrio sp.]